MPLVQGWVNVQMCGASPYFSNFSIQHTCTSIRARESFEKLARSCYIAFIADCPLSAVQCIQGT
jgi:hypothetical protein